MSFSCFLFFLYRQYVCFNFRYCCFDTFPFRLNGWYIDLFRVVKLIGKNVIKKWILELNGIRFFLTFNGFLNKTLTSKIMFRAHALNRVSSARNSVLCVLCICFDGRLSTCVPDKHSKPISEIKRWIKKICTLYLGFIFAEFSPSLSLSKFYLQIWLIYIYEQGKIFMTKRYI